MGGVVETGGDPDEAGGLKGLFRLGDKADRSLTHGFHTYAARLHPSMVHAAVERWSRQGMRVLDPFCGSGTVLVEALSQGRAAVGSDASPLAVELTRVRTTVMNEERRARLVAEAAAIAEASAEMARTRKKPELPAWSRGERERFHPHVLLEMLGLRAAVFAAAADDEDVARALRLCFSSILVKFMKAGPGAPRDGEDKRIGRGIPSHFFAARARELAKGLAALEAKLLPGTPDPIVQVADARAVSFIKSGSIDLVVTSPPYAGTYDYAEQHDVRFRWLGLPMGRFEKAQLGTRARGLGADARAWAEARKQWLGEIARVLRPRGLAVIVVGDGIVVGPEGDRPENAGKAVAEAGASLGLTFVARASEERPAPDRRVRAVFASSPRYEHAVLLRKG